MYNGLKQPYNIPLPVYGNPAYASLLDSLKSEPKLWNENSAVINPCSNSRSSFSSLLSREGPICAQGTWNIAEVDTSWMKGPNTGREEDIVYYESSGNRAEFESGSNLGEND